MTRSIEALYEDGVLRPLEPLNGLAEHSRVRLTLELGDTIAHPAHPFTACIGTLPDEDAEDMLRFIEEEFEKIDLDAWR